LAFALELIQFIIIENQRQCSRCSGFGSGLAQALLGHTSSAQVKAAVCRP